MSVLNLKIKRFDESILSLDIAGMSMCGLEFRIYYICDGRNHFKISIPIGRSPQQAHTSAEKISACDKEACQEGRLMDPVLLPWQAQEAVGFYRQVPPRMILVHQRYKYDGSPTFRVYESGEEYTPAQGKEGRFLPNGQRTLVLFKNFKSNELRAVMISNHGGKAQQTTVSRIKEIIQFVEG